MFESGDSSLVKPDARSLAKNMLFNTVGCLTYQGCMWLITILAVVLSNNYENSGTLAFAMATGNMFFAIGTYNMRTFQVSDVDNDYSQGEYLAFRLVTIILAWAVILPYSIVMSGNNTVFVVTVLYLFFKTDESFVDALYGVDQRLQRMEIIGISQLLRGIAVVSAFVVGLRTTNSIGVSIACMTLLMLTITVFYDLPRARNLEEVRLSISKRTCIALVRSCLPIAAAPLLTNMVVSIPRQVFSHLYGLEELGIYAAIATPAVLIQAAARYLYSPLLVPLANEWRAKDGERFFTSIKRVILIMGLVAIIMIVALSFVGNNLLPMVYGAKVQGYLYLFPYVLISTAAIALFWFLTDVLIICRDVMGQLVASGSAAAAAFVSMVPCEKIFYMNGINTTIILSISVGILVALARIIRVLHRDSSSNE